MSKHQPLLYQSVHNNTCSGTFLYSVGTHHGNLMKLLVTTIMVIILFQGPTRETVSAKTNAVKLQGADLWKTLR